MLIFPLHFPTDISVALFLHRCPLCMSFSFIFESLLSSHSFVSLTLSFLSPILVRMWQRTGEDRTVASATQQCNQRFTMRGRLESHMQQHLKHSFLSAFPRTIMKTKYSFMQLCISEDCNKEKKNHSLIKASATFIIKNHSFIMNALFSLALRCSQP